MTDHQLLLGIAEALEERGYAHMTNGESIGWIVDENERLASALTAATEENKRLKERVGELEAENAINAEDALRALEFDLVLGQAYRDVVEYSTTRIAAIKSKDTQATLDARDLMLRKTNDRLRNERDGLRGAAEKVIEMNRQHAHDQYGDADKAESWACVTVLLAALTPKGPTHDE